MGRRRNKTGSAPPSPGGPSQPVAATPKHAGGASTDRSGPIAATPPKHAGGASTDPTTVDGALSQRRPDHAIRPSRRWARRCSSRRPAAALAPLVGGRGDAGRLSPASSKASSEPRETGRDPSPASAAQWSPPAAATATATATTRALPPRRRRADHRRADDRAAVDRPRAARGVPDAPRPARRASHARSRGLAVVARGAARAALDGNGLPHSTASMRRASRPPRGAQRARRGVGARPKLRTLDLRHNALRIPRAGARRRSTLRLGHTIGGCEQLRHAPRLHTLELDHNALGSGAITPRSRVLHRSRACTLDVRANPLEHQPCLAASRPTRGSRPPPHHPRRPRRRRRRAAPAPTRRRR